MHFNLAKWSFLVGFLLVLQCLNSWSTGVIIFTDVSGAHSQMVNYQTYTQPTAHLSFITTADGQRTQIRTDRITAIIPTPSPGVTASSTQIQEYMVECDVAAGRHPKFADRLRRLKNAWAARLQAVQQQEAEVAEQRRLADIEAQKKEAAWAEQRRLDEIEAQKKEAALAEQRRLDEIEAQKKEAALAAQRRQDEIAKREKARLEMEARVVTLTAEISELEGKLKRLVQQIPKEQNSEYELRDFVLKRKLPHQGFAELYLIADHVYECIFSGGEMCILVSHSLPTLEERHPVIWTKRLLDMDVRMRDNSNERVPVFVEAAPRLSASLTKSREDFASKYNAIDATSTQLEERRKQLNAIQVTLGSQ